MADQKSDPKPQPKKEAAPLGDAAASSDPVVQNLLAQREIAIRNGDEDAASGFTARLAELGVA
jgi:hypothetical protein